MFTFTTTRTIMLFAPNIVYSLLSLLVNTSLAIPMHSGESSSGSHLPSWYEPNDTLYSCNKPILQPIHQHTSLHSSEDVVRQSLTPSTHLTTWNGLAPLPHSSFERYAQRPHAKSPYHHADYRLHTESLLFTSSPTSKQEEEHQQKIYSHQQRQNQRWNSSPTPHEQVQHSVPVASGGENQLSANREQELASMINYFSHELQDPACTANDQFHLAAPYRTADQLSNHCLYNRYGGSIGSVSSNEWRHEGCAVESGSSSHSGFFGSFSSQVGQHTKLIHHTGLHHEDSIVHSAESLAVQTPGKELYMTDFDEFRSELLQGLELMNTLPSWYICIPVEIRASAFRHFIYIIRTYLSTKARVTKLSRELLFEALLRNGHPFLIEQLATDTVEGPDTLYTVVHLLEVPGGNANMLMERHDEVVRELQLRMPRATFAEAGRQLRSALKNNYYLQDLLDAGDLTTYQATISRIPTGRFALNLERLARGEEYGLDGPNFSDIFSDKVVRENVLNRLMPIWGLNRRQLRRYLRRKCINKRDIVLLLQDDSTFDQAQKCLRP